MMDYLVVVQPSYFAILHEIFLNSALGVKFHLVECVCKSVLVSKVIKP